jgi:hypothetical protein
MPKLHMTDIVVSRLKEPGTYYDHPLPFKDPTTVFAGAKTICIASSTLPVAGSGGCPSGAQVVQQSSWDTVINTYATSSVRILLNKGDTFTFTQSNLTISTSGPGIIDSYGTGAAPVIEYTGASVVSALTMAANVCDWRVRNGNRARLRAAGGGARRSHRSPRC